MKMALDKLVLTNLARLGEQFIFQKKNSNVRYLFLPQFDRGYPHEEALKGIAF